MNRNISHSARVNRDGDLGDRFWYWHGASGRAYIHSVYPVRKCPPVPGAVFIAVRRDANGVRIPCAVDRFTSLSGIIGFGAANVLHADGRIEEVHVHLLARTEEEAAFVLADLRASLIESKDVGLREAACPFESCASRHPEPWSGDGEAAWFHAPLR